MISNGPLSAVHWNGGESAEVHVFDVAMRSKLILDIFGRATPMESRCGRR